MFDIGWQELFVLAVLAIIVIGPKDLPRAVKAVTHWIRKARGMARDLQDGFDDMVRESDLAEIKKHANSIMDGAHDPTGAITRELDMTDETKSWAGAVDDLKNATDPTRKAGASEVVDAAEAADTIDATGHDAADSADAIAADADTMADPSADTGTDTVTDAWAPGNKAGGPSKVDG